MIAVEGLTKRYARHVAVDRISFEVGKGQIVGFLGPNGAGKTTTMRILTCFMPPSAGTAMVAGFDVMKAPGEVKRRIGYLPETPPLYPEMSVTEYLMFVARLKQIAAGEVARRVGSVVERTSLGDVRHKLIAKLSKGYRQRVGLAQAIIHNPDVLILDEPTSGLDPKQINETRALIRELAGDHTIILSTHILPEVEQTCEKVVVIAKGKVVATDTVQNLTTQRQGGAVVTVELDGAPTEDAAHHVLETVPGIARAERLEAHGTRYRFRLDGATGEELRGDVARAVVGAGWNLLELRGAAVSLEEIFLQLTGTDALPASAAEVPEEPVSLSKEDHQ